MGFYRVTAGELRQLPLESSLLEHGLLSNDQVKRIKSEVFRILEENGVHCALVTYHHYPYSPP